MTIVELMAHSQAIRPARDALLLGGDTRSTPPAPAATGAAGPVVARRPASNDRLALLLRSCVDGSGSCCAACAAEKQEEASGLTMSRRDDPAEREADTLARQIVAGRSARALARVAAAGALPVESRIADRIGSLAGTGSPLEATTRSTMERALGQDLGDVRVHSGPEVARLARAVDADAFTVGTDVFLGSGRAARGHPESDYVLAHELVHTTQVSTAGNARTLYRLSPKACAKPDACELPDTAGSGATATKWSLTLAVDREEEGLGRLKSGDVGHTWLKLDDNTGEAWSFGMWPQRGFNSSRPFSDCKGCIYHPDKMHEPPRAVELREIKYDIERDQYDAALAYAKATCKAKPDYNLVSYNCTTFAIEAARAAGISTPASTTLAIHNPNALFEGIEEELAKRNAPAPAVKGAGGSGKKKAAAPEPDTITIKI